MTVKDGIINIIKERICISVPVTEYSNLYTDLGFDSLSFIALLTEIEAAYGVIFDIAEMELCLETQRLIATVENKVKERDDD